MRIRSTSPWAPSLVLHEGAACSITELDEVLDRARAAQTSWARTPPGERAAALERLADALERRVESLTELVTNEVGKPIREARAEIHRGVAILRYNAQLALAAEGQCYPDSAGLLLTRRRPRGVAALITPWNFPIAIPLWKLAPALAVGNTVVIKPAPQASATMLAVRELAEAVLPNGVINVVLGHDEIGERLVQHPAVDCVSFTGSERVGHAVIERAAQRQLPVQAEMGGSNPAVVLPGADLDMAAGMVAGAAMGFAGQKCTATSRIVVTEDSYGPFLERLLARIDELQVGDPSDERTVVSPVISEQARDVALKAIADAITRGGSLLRGGDPLPDGHTLSPTLVQVDSVDDELACREVFAPVAAVIVVADVDAAVATANAGSYGLAAAVYTTDMPLAMEVIDALDAGMIRINQPTTGVDLHAPFGGVKASSYGLREQGPTGPAFYSQEQTIQLGGAA